MIRVLVVDDSPTCRRTIRAALESDPHILVLGEAGTGREAMAAIERSDPDLVTMDLMLGDESGFDVTREIMSRWPRPILIVTAADTSNPDLLYRALANGALDVVSKPSAAEGREASRGFAHLVRTLGAIPVLHRRRGVPTKPAPPRPEPAQPAAREPAPQLRPGATELIAVGASTGGPPIVASLFPPPALAACPPIVVVQHIATGFAAGFAAWLAQVTSYPSVLVDKPTPLAPGVIHVAPDHANLVFSARGQLAPQAPSPNARVIPSIDALFTSAAEQYGASVLAVVLTGMGRDGASGLRALCERGAVTIAQAPETCTVDSMPRSAVDAGAARFVLRPEEIAALLRTA